MKEKYMNAAIKEAKKALQIDEMPVGAIIVYQNKIIGRGYNKKEQKNNPLMHAELIAIKQAAKYLNDWRLNKCSMYVTMEPCSMCMGSIIESRIEKVICGVRNEKYKETNDFMIKKFKIDIEYGILNSNVENILKNFFKLIRNR